MKIISKAIVSNQYKRNGGFVIFELDNCTEWMLIDNPFINAVGREAKVWRDGRKHYIQIDGSSEKFAVDEM